MDLALICLHANSENILGKMMDGIIAKNLGLHLFCASTLHLFALRFFEKL